MSNFALKTLNSKFVIQDEQCESLEEAHDRAATLWLDQHVLAIIVYSHNTEDARYERTGIAPEMLPAGWPLRKKVLGQPSGDATWEAQPPPVPPTLFNDAPKTAAQPQTKDLSLCRCCGGPLNVAYVYDKDKSPSGRLNENRCPQCGKPWADAKATRTAILKRYLAAIDHQPNVIDTKKR